jgi:hypothetical protein
LDTQRFLRALGYASDLRRPATVDEDIQMHSDALWQRVLQHEEAAAKAKEQGLPVPQFDPVVPRVADPSFQPTDEVKQAWAEKLKTLPEDERPAEEAALRADYAAKATVARDVRSLREAEKEERKARQAEGKGTIMDAIQNLVGGGK